MKRLGWTAGVLLTAGLSAGLLVGVSAGGQKTLQQGFEGRNPLWTPGAADAVYKETAHRITDEFAKDGRRSEYIELNAEPGSYIHYTYDVGKAIVSDELNVSLWVKANRPGIQLLCRVVLPREHDPQNLDQTVNGAHPARRLPDHRPLAAIDAASATETAARAVATDARRT